jgi:hypothetical protein
MLTLLVLVIALLAAGLTLILVSDVGFPPVLRGG